VELRLAYRQAAAAEYRVQEQQITIEGLQSQLAGSTHELETASGSAGEVFNTVGVNGRVRVRVFAYSTMYHA
jgi:hypothetical protein